MNELLIFFFGTKGVENSEDRDAKTKHDSLMQIWVSVKNNKNHSCLNVDIRSECKIPE